MIRLEEIQRGLTLVGLEPTALCSVITVVPIAEGTIQVIYKTPDGTIKDRMLNRADESSLSVATTERPWSFDGEGDAFKLAVEAKRIDLAFLFDPMMAVHTSNVDPLPHQITAVYQSMLPQQPLRFVLADDPGAGKTIMAGLYIRELIMRADSRRILVVAPGSLVENWRGEMFGKFGLEFRVFDKSLESATHSGNPFEDIDHLIVRLDQLARDEVGEGSEEKKPGPLQTKLLAAGWDLVIMDEAHKLAAHYFGSKLDKTGRFRFAERLGARTRHFLLMTATPHNGKHDDFQLFLSLLDSDRFYGKFRGGGDAAHQIDANDLMRRMVKEEMLRFDGTRLFPERKAYTANYKLAKIESALYEAVTSYVKTEMGKADALKGPRKGSVGFALTALQRRLASSPEAIFQSLKRRKDRLEKRLREERLLSRGQQFHAQAYETPPEDDDDLDAEEQENLEEKLIDTAFDSAHIKDLLERNALAQETMSPERLFAVKELMETAEARRLQPYFVRAFFAKAFEGLGGAMYPREPGRFEITHVPALIRERDRQITGRNRRELAPVLKRYERVCFMKEAVRPLDRPNTPFAQMIHPGHPLMLAVSDMVLEQHSNLMRQGAILVDPADEATEGSLLFLITHEIKSGDSSILSKRLQFVHVTPAGKASFAGWAPHLDYEPLAATDRPLLDELLASDWIRADQEQRAIALAATTLVPEHFHEVATRRIAHVDKTLAAVHERLTKEIDFWSDRWMRLKEDQEAGKDVRLNLDNIQRTINDLNGRLENRKKELQSMRHVTNGTPIVLGGALIVPIGLLRKLRGEPSPDAVIAPFSADPAARSRIEQLAMQAVCRAEEARGCRVVDVSAQKCGWDITSYVPPVNGKISESRHIEVKGRIQGATTVTVTKNEIFQSWNQGAKYHLAIVLVSEDDTIDGPHYVQHPFKEEPGWGVSSVNFDLKALLERSVK